MLYEFDLLAVSIDRMTRLKKQGEHMSKYKGVIVGSALFILLSFVFGFHYVKGEMIKEKVANFKLPAISVTTEKVNQDTWDKSLKVIGNIHSNQSIDVTSQMSGQVKEILFTSGQQVNKGDVLVKLDDALLKSNYKSQLSKVELVRVELMRNKLLLRNNSVSKNSVDKLQAQFNAEGAKLEYIATQIDYMKVKAPFSGSVGIRNIDVGDFINSSTAIVELEDKSKQYVDFSIPELYLHDVKVGQDLQFYSEATNDEVFHGTISAIEPSSDSNTHNIELRAMANQAVPLEAGMYVDATLITSESDTIVAVPSVAISYTLYGNTVFVLDTSTKKASEHSSNDASPFYEYKVVQRTVEVGPKQGGYVGVVSGLKEGDVVVTSNQHQLKNSGWVLVNNQHPLITDKSTKQSN
ncbi:efflux transporter periplasmic adaptor subunit [Vibrio splendidus]|jgi:membrane fusion protein (multidrug efflux system)|uniref:Efflux transporter periplasmic adaptor subunit n=3 Tax=Vibrio splendidus TaxID=29497 RepID=A0A0P6Z371_VIBSP|nr:MULTISPECIES: efflux RND transporter periplasmic adaptor subunit [Vibrio]OEF37816.1 efflux transporter periplasmic adaptor subunit [Vibrio splendidus 1S-124]PME34705.1 efflux transporter periplasmic adaptor subunit [Vibrio sp. 10N.286.55.E10]PME35353.1 efflux transporter periplasmic adaptor subunit [Vibrio sp. 10N.286.55.E12]PME67191.1 efflux transporter periplasmic adaptor subunit [Vibrio sp. 10N.286.55.C11]TKE60956.1 efflux RND transporter periplasmic adaptor subunit [Vibrio sp. F12]CAK3